MTDLFDPLNLGRYHLAHRIALAPLTRNRAGAGGVPRDISAEYYRQRASAGLIVTEGTQPSAIGQGYLDTPGIHSEEQVAGWARVADAVHAEGGLIFLQLMHAGRIAHPDNKSGLESVAPSALRAEGMMVTAAGEKPHAMPRALETSEIPKIIAEFVHAAEQAMRAGLDGVEVHSANGYLLHQFLAPSTNLRTDGYGGPAPARARLSLEVTTAIAEAIGADRVGIRISPAHNIQGVLETDPVDVADTYGHLVDQLAKLGLAYLSVLADPALPLVQNLRSRFGGPLMANSGFASTTDVEQAREILDSDLAELVAVGRLFLANPDLPQRWRTGAAVNEPVPETFYGGNGEGYTDYPTLAESRR
ncbi:MAG: alkene reductase [Angustibacter sp.]